MKKSQFDLVPDLFESVKLGDVRLNGIPGSYAESCIRTRAYSDWARGRLYEEAANSFRTHWDDRNNSWQNEYWGKTMLCFAGAADYTGDAELKAWILEKTHSFIDEFQQENGYLSTYSDENCLISSPENPDPRSHWGFNVWGRKYTLWALVEIYRVTGDKKCLDSAVKLTDHLIESLKRNGRDLHDTGAWHGISSASILSPLLALYRFTGNGAYLELAHQTVRRFDGNLNNPGEILRDAFRDEKICDWYPLATYWAKAYEIMSCLEGLLDYYRITGEKRVFDGVVAYYNHLESEELNAMRSVGYFDHFLNARQRLNGMSELCDVIYWIRLNHELLNLTGEARFADRIEEAFYNAFLAGVTRDGRWGAHIIKSHGTRHLEAPPQVGMIDHQCCPDNMMRGYFAFAESTAAISDDGTVSVFLYSDADAELRGARVRISGGYPWGDVPVVVTISRAEAGRVRFRIPEWSRTFSINNATVTSEDGWHIVDAPTGESTWTLRFDLEPRLVDHPCDNVEYPAPWPLRYDVNSIESYTTHFMTWKTPEMQGLQKLEPGSQVFRGPLVLAKGRLAGTSREETLFTRTVRGHGWSVSMMPVLPKVENAAVPRSWMLTLSREGVCRTFPVADFASLSNVYDPENWFSLWF